MPPPEVLQRAAVNLEATIERAEGFGGHARLITITLDNFNVYVVEVPINFDNDPTEHLRRLVTAALATDTELNFKELAEQGTIGWFYTQEIQADTSSSALTQMLHNNPDTAPRTRFVLGMDLLGRIYHCIRQEGEDPKIVTGGRPIMAGTAPQALRLLNIAVAEHHPNNSRYLKALAKVEIKTMEEMADFALTEGAQARGIYQASPPPAQNT